MTTLDSDILVSTTVENADFQQVDVIYPDWYDWQSCSDIIGEVPLGGCDRTAFITAFRNIVTWSNVDFFWYTKAVSGTTNTEFSDNGHTVTFGRDISLMSPTEAGFSNSLTFTLASQDHGKVSHHSSLSFGDGSSDEAFTLMVFVKPSSGAGDQGLISKYDASSLVREYLFQITALDLGFLVYDNSASAFLYYLTTGDVLTMGTWQFWAATYDGAADIDSSFNFYIDGSQYSGSVVKLSTGTYTAMESLSGADFCIAAEDSGSGTTNEYRNGDMVFAAAIREELTPSQISSLNTVMHNYMAS